MKGRSLGRGLWASGIGLAVAGITLFIALVAGWYPPTDEIQVDGTVLGFTAGLSLVTGIVSGVAPALRSFAVSLTASLKAGAQGALEGSHHRVSDVLVVAEAALALVLLVGVAGLVKVRNSGQASTAVTAVSVCWSVAVSG